MELVQLFLVLQELLFTLKFEFFYIISYDIKYGFALLFLNM